MAVVRVYQRGEQRLLACVIAVERAGRDAGGLDDIAQRRGAEALIQKFRPCGRVDAIERG